MIQSTSRATGRRTGRPQEDRIPRRYPKTSGRVAAHYGQSGISGPLKAWWALCCKSTRTPCSWSAYVSTECCRSHSPELCDDRRRVRESCRRGRPARAVELVREALAGGAAGGRRGVGLLALRPGAGFRLPPPRSPPRASSDAPFTSPWISSRGFTGTARARRGSGCSPNGTARCWRKCTTSLLDGRAIAARRDALMEEARACFEHAPPPIARPTTSRARRCRARARAVLGGRNRRAASRFASSPEGCGGVEEMLIAECGLLI